VTVSARQGGGTSAVLVHPVRDPRLRDKTEDEAE
jgi:hypothetical protein